MNEASDPALGDHGFAIVEALKSVNVGSFRFVLPDDLFLERDLGGHRPRVVKQDVAVGQQLHIVMTGVPSFGSPGLVFPDDRSVGFANCEDILAVGGS